MYPKELNTIFLFKLSLLINKIPLFLFRQYPTVLSQKLSILSDRLWRYTIINQLLNFFINEKRRCQLFISLPDLNCGFDLVDQSFDLNGTIVFDICSVLALDENLTKTLAGV